MNVTRREGSWQSDALRLFGACVAIGAITGCHYWFNLTNPTIAALSYLLVILFTAAVSTLMVATASSVIAVVCLNYFFMPPVGTFWIADPQHWVALFTFLAVSVAASNLSAAARDRASIAVERAELLEARKSAELARQSEELKSMLLASLAHDLKTPLTAIRIAASNLQATWLKDVDRREQSDLILAEVERLSRLFQSILEMARIDAGAITTDVRWVHPAEIFEAARDQVEQALRQHRIEVELDSQQVVRLDPRLTGSALAHILENAAQYTEAGSRIDVRMSVSSDGLTVTVRDHGSGIIPSNLPHLFDRFYRGTEASRRVSGTGMGLSIARGMLAAEHGRVFAENCQDGGAQFTMVIPAEYKAATEADPA